MIYFLYGPDEYRRARRVSQIMNELSEPDTSIKKVDLEGGVFSSVSEFLHSASLFSYQKLLILRSAYKASTSELKAELIPFLESTEVNIIISESKKPPKPLSFLIKEPSKSELFENLKGAEWTGFIKKEATLASLKLEDEAIALLANYHQGDSWGLATEIKKLSFLNKKISVEDLRKEGIDTAQEYWPLIQSLKGVSTKKRLFAMEKIFAGGDAAAKTFNILAVLWKERAVRFAAYDRAIKSGKVEYEEALLDSIL